MPTEARIRASRPNADVRAANSRCCDNVASICSSCVRTSNTGSSLSILADGLAHHLDQRAGSSGVRTSNVIEPRSCACVNAR